MNPLLHRRSVLAAGAALPLATVGPPAWSRARAYDAVVAKPASGRTFAAPAYPSLSAAIAAAAPLSVRGNKRVIDVLAANPTLSDAQEEELVELRRSCFGSADFREGITAFAEKRKPAWGGIRCPARRSGRAPL